MSRSRKTPPPHVEADVGTDPGPVSGIAPDIPGELLPDLLAGLLEEVAESVLVLDAQGLVVHANPAAEQAIGLALEDMVGRACARLEDCEHLHLHEDRCPMEKAAETGKRQEAIYTRVDEDGRSNYLRAVTVPLPAGERPPRLFLRIRQDVTGMAARERRFRLSDKLAAIGELSTYIAHEIRNPLFAIGGFADALLRSKTLESPDRSKVGIIREESKRLDNILKSIINFARPLDGAPGESDINAVVRQAVRLVDQGQGRRAADAPSDRRPDVRLELDPAQPKVRGDSGLFVQCVLNMLKNSLEAMPQGGRILVRTRVEDAYVILVVSDTGTGIPEDVQAQVFNPFFSTKDRGAGLGLAMTKKIVEDLGGMVRLESEPGRGTTVTLLLTPVLGLDETAADDETAPSDGTAEPGPSGD